MINYNQDPVIIDGLILYLVTGNAYEGAILVGFPDCRESERIWVPKSLIIDTNLDYLSDESLYTEGYITIPRWKARKVGLE